MVLETHLAKRADGTLTGGLAAGQADDDVAPDADGGHQPRALGRRLCAVRDEDLALLAISSPARMRSSVVFPLPDAPSSATNSPWATVRSSSARTSRWPNDFETSKTMAAGWVVGRFTGPPDDGARAWGALQDANGMSA